MVTQGTNLSMVRGDTENIFIAFTNETGTPIPFVTGDTIYFTVKKSVDTTEKVMQKIITEFQDGKAVVGISHNDTKDLDYGCYYYDIQYTMLDGTVKTIIPPSKFQLKGEITFE